MRIERMAVLAVMSDSLFLLLLVSSARYLTTEDLAYSIATELIP